MGKEAKSIKDRTCLKCKGTFQTDAEGIKTHAENCNASH